MSNEQSIGRYKIGAVSNMTGIAPETLRMWERRYALIRPTRGETRVRLYSDRDVRHLMLIGRLVSAGHAISSLADLGEDELERRLKTHQEMQRNNPAAAKPDVITVCVLGSTLPAQLQTGQPKSGTLRFSGLYSSLAEFERLIVDAHPDVLVLEYQSLMPDDVKELRERFRFSKAQQLIIVYTFASSATLRKLRDAATRVVQGPVNCVALEQLCLAGPQGLPDTSRRITDTPEIPRQFTDAQLGKIATIQTDVGCECPHHVALILSKLTAFETYSQNCEDRNDDDAALHAHLRSITMQARATFEAALPDILEADGIDINEL